MAINEAFKYHCGVIDGDTIVFRKDANYNNITYSDSKLLEILFPNKNDYSLNNFEAMEETKRHLSHLTLNMNASAISNLYKINISEIKVGPLISITFEKSSVSKEVTWLCNTVTGTLKGPLLDVKNAVITVGSAAKEGGKIAASATSRAAVYTGGVLASVPGTSVQVLQSTGRGIRDFPKNHPQVVHSAQALGAFSAYFSFYMLMVFAIALL